MKHRSRFSYCKSTSGIILVVNDPHYLFIFLRSFFLLVGLSNMNLKIFFDRRYDAIEMRGSKTGIEVQKFRDHRDLHNSMERQRRVDLRHNFDLLKSAVPDLAINGKASKLNILKQGALYCQRLNKLNNRMKETTSAEQARNMALRKKLQQLESQFHVRRPSARQIKPRRL